MVITSKPPNAHVGLCIYTFHYLPRQMKLNKKPNAVEEKLHLCMWVCVCVYMWECVREREKSSLITRREHCPALTESHQTDRWSRDMSRWGPAGRRDTEGWREWQRCFIMLISTGVKVGASAGQDRGGGGDLVVVVGWRGWHAPPSNKALTHTHIHTQSHTHTRPGFRSPHFKHSFSHNHFHIIHFHTIPSPNHYQAH